MGNILPAIPGVETMIAETSWSGLIGMAITDDKGIVLAANERLCGLLEYTERELVGRHFRDITIPSDQRADEQAFGDLMAGKFPHYCMSKTWIGKRQKLIAGTMYVQWHEQSSVFAVAQVVQAQSPEQSAAMTETIRMFMDDILSRQGLQIVPQVPSSSAVWYKNWAVLGAIGAAWPVVVFLFWVSYQIAKLIEMSNSGPQP